MSVVKKTNWRYEVKDGKAVLSAWPTEKQAYADKEKREKERRYAR